MRIISFAETTPALLAGRKTVTRRNWKDGYARSFQSGELLQAWDKSPRLKAKGAHQVAVIRLTAEPRLSLARDLPAWDWEAEGFAYMEERGLTLFGGQTPMQVWESWKAARDGLLWVVRFELVEVLG